MNTLLRFLQVFSIGIWVGSIIYFGAVVAPAAFSVLNIDLAGALVGASLTRLHVLGFAVGAIYLLATAVVERSFAALVRPAPLLVLLMIVLTGILQFYVIGNMEALRAQMIHAGASVSATSPANPLRISFDRLHTLSVRLEMGVLFSGIAALLLTVRRFSI